jgi:hypothetical protein
MVLSGLNEIFYPLLARLVFTRPRPTGVINPTESCSGALLRRCDALSFWVACDWLSALHGGTLSDYSGTAPEKKDH